MAPFSWYSLMASQPPSLLHMEKWWLWFISVELPQAESRGWGLQLRNQVGISTLLFISCVTLGKYLDFSETL